MTTAVQVQYRRGTASQVTAFTGAQGELVIDTTNSRVVVQDGATAGGWPAAKLSEVVPSVNGLTGAVTIAATDGNVVTASGSTVTLGGPGGMVSKFRNGTMDVWQRGTGPITISTSGGYAADGWIVLPAGASVTAAQAGGRLLTKNSLQVTGATSVTDVIVKQRIESLIAAAFCSQIVTVQAQVYNNTGASITPLLTVKHAGSQDVWTSPTTDVNAVSLQPCASGGWTQVGYTFSANANSYNGLEIAFDFGSNFGANTKTVQITECDIRVTPGAAAGLNADPPPPELRPIATELGFCQRYFTAWSSTAANSPFASGFVDTSTSALFGLFFPVSMRAAPSFMFSASNTFQVRPAGGSGLTGSAISASLVTAQAAQIALTISGAAAASGLLRDAGSTNSYIQASAEL
jgi:Major tropism determinant N-terminal domain